MQGRQYMPTSAQISPAHPTNRSPCATLPIRPDKKPPPPLLCGIAGGGACVAAWHAQRKFTVTYMRRMHTLHASQKQPSLLLCNRKISREPSAAAESEESARAAAAQGHTCRHGCRRRWCMVLCCWLGCRARCRPRCSCGSRLGPGGCNKGHPALARKLDEQYMDFTPRLWAHLRAGVAWSRLLSCCATEMNAGGINGTELLQNVS